MQVYYPNNQWTFYAIPPLIALAGLFYILMVEAHLSWTLATFALFSFLLSGYCLYERFATKLTVHIDRIELHRKFQCPQSFYYTDHEFVIGPTYDGYHRKRYVGRSAYFFIYPLDEYGTRIKMSAITLEFAITQGLYKKIQKDLATRLTKMDLLAHLRYNNNNGTIIVRNR